MVDHNIRQINQKLIISAAVRIKNVMTVSFYVNISLMRIIREYVAGYRSEKTHITA